MSLLEVPWNKLKHYPSFLFLIVYLLFINYLFQKCNDGTLNIFFKTLSGLIIVGIMIYIDYYFESERKRKSFSALGDWNWSSGDDPEFDKPDINHYSIWVLLVIVYGLVVWFT